MQTLKQKTITGLTWSTIEKISKQSINFIVTILIARVLVPADYGLIGMLAIFIAVGNSLLEGGFSAALIQKKDADEKDFSTVFYINITAGIILYTILFFAAPLIANFYDSPNLISITRVISLNLVISSFGLTQYSYLLKQINFKALAKISISSEIFAGCIGIYLAYNGFGVWSLVFHSISGNVFRVVYFWVLKNLRPQAVFSSASFKKLFSFGSKLMLSNLITHIFDNIYYIVIGKYFSSTALGFYSQAHRIQQVPVQSVTQIVAHVTYPVYSKMQEDDERLKNNFIRTVKGVVFFTFPIMIGLVVTADQLIKVLLTEKWLASALYLKVLCIIGLTAPIIAINLNILKVKAKTNLFLYLETLNKVIIIFAIGVCLSSGLYALVWGQAIASVIYFFINSYYTGKQIQYSVWQLLKNIFPMLLFSILMGAVIYMISFAEQIETLFLLIIEILAGTLFYLFVSYIFKLDAFIEIKSLMSSAISAKFNKQRK